MTPWILRRWMGTRSCGDGSGPRCRRQGSSRDSTRTSSTRPHGCGSRRQRNPLISPQNKAFPACSRPRRPTGPTDAWGSSTNPRRFSPCRRKEQTHEDPYHPQRAGGPGDCRFRIPRVRADRRQRRLRLHGRRLPRRERRRLQRPGPGRRRRRHPQRCRSRLRTAHGRHGQSPGRRHRL